MPINSLGNEIDYSTDQDVQYMMESQDYNVEFIGFLAEVNGWTKTVQNEDLFKAVITNGSKRISLLIWEPSIVSKLFDNLKSGQILHLDGCQGHVVKGRKEHQMMNLLNYDIIIQVHSTVTPLGFHVYNIKPKQAKEIPVIEFIDISKSTGDIKVKAYIKTIITLAHNEAGSLNFGSGAITDGIHKVSIQVDGFKMGDLKNLEKGSCVMISAKINSSGDLRLICKNISCIEEVTSENKLASEIVSKANKPLKRCVPVSNTEPPKKKFVMDVP